MHSIHRDICRHSRGHTTVAKTHALVLHSSNSLLPNIICSALKCIWKVGERRKNTWLDLGSFKPETIQFTIEHLQKSTRQSNSMFSPRVYIHWNSRSLSLRVPQIAISQGVQNFLTISYSIFLQHPHTAIVSFNFI